MWCEPPLPTIIHDPSPRHVIVLHPKPGSPHLRQPYSYPSLYSTPYLSILNPSPVSPYLGQPPPPFTGHCTCTFLLSCTPIPGHQCIFQIAQDSLGILTESQCSTNLGCVPLLVTYQNTNLCTWLMALLLLCWVEWSPAQLEHYSSARWYLHCERQVQLPQCRQCHENICPFLFNIIYNFGCSDGKVLVCSVFLIVNVIIKIKFVQKDPITSISSEQRASVAFFDTIYLNAFCSKNVQKQLQDPFFADDFGMFLNNVFFFLGILLHNKMPVS